MAGKRGVACCVINGRRFMHGHGMLGKMGLAYLFVISRDDCSEEAVDSSFFLPIDRHIGW